MKKLTLALAAALLSVSAWAQTPDTAAILKTIDEQSNFDNIDFSGEFTIVSSKPGEENNISVARLFRRDAKQQFMILILKPEVQKGQGYLKEGDNLWFYDPDSRKFAFSSLKENFNNSDARNSDFNRSNYSKDYKVTKAEAAKLGKFDVWVMELEATNNEVSYPKIKMWVRKDNSLILKTESYSLSGRLMRTAAFPEYTNVDGRFIASKILLINNLKEGEKTQLSAKDLSTKPLPDIFNKNYLERVNR